METPKNKAIELYNKFREANGLMAANGYAKKQAIICVDEIIKAFDLYGNDLMGEINYWQEVKTKLNKL
jgi:hypothetical protein